MEGCFLYNPSGPQCAHGANILACANGDLLVCWYSYPEKEHIGGKIVLCRYLHEQKKWEKVRHLFQELRSSQGNPVLFHLPDGRIGLLFVLLKGNYWDSCEIYLSFSKDNGLSWSQPYFSRIPAGVMPRNKPLILDGETLLLPVYHETEKTSCLMQAQFPDFSWEVLYEFPEKAIQPELQMIDSVLYAFFRPIKDPLNIRLSQSYDRGVSWTPVSLLPLDSALSANSSFLINNNIYIVYNNTKEHKRYPLSIAFSKDLGKTWSQAWDFENIRYEVSYPSFTLGMDRKIHGVYTYNRKMIKYVNFSENAMQMSSATSLQKIRDFKNLHQGKRLFILASGCSLNHCDLSKLKNKMVMGLNRSGLIYPETMYHCVMDKRLFEDYEKILLKTRILFTLENCPWGIPIKLLGSEGFSFDLEQGIYSGYTIAFFALQLAYYMGFEEVFFLGLDLCHEKGKTHFFGHDYRSRNHQNTEFPKMQRMLKYACAQLKQEAIKVYNCSPISTENIFPKMPYEKAISL